jgi:hypothetical protein
VQGEFICRGVNGKAVSEILIDCEIVTMFPGLVSQAVFSSTEFVICEYAKFVTAKMITSVAILLENGEVFIDKFDFSLKDLFKI